MTRSDNSGSLNPKEYLQQNKIGYEDKTRQLTLYYPGAGGDFEPLKLFVENSVVSKVIYCDYAREYVWSVLKSKVYKNLTNSNYEILNSIEIEPKMFGVNSWKNFWPSNPASCCHGDPSRAFGMLMDIRFIPNNKVINFIYLCTEAVQTYKILFSDKKVPPLVVVIQDHGTGGNWTRFDLDSDLYKIAKPALPEFIYVANNSEPWKGYKQVSGYGEGEGSADHKRSLFKRLQLRIHHLKG